MTPFGHVCDFFNDLTTSRDGVSFDPIRVGFLVSLVVLLGLAGWDIVVNHQPLNPLGLGSGIAALFAGAGFGIGQKKADEPPA